MNVKLCKRFVAFIVTLIMIFSTAMPALAAPAQGTVANVGNNVVYTIHSAVNNDFVLDVKGAGKTNGTKIQLYKSNGTAAQKFLFKRNSDGSYTLINSNANKAVDIPGNSTYSGAGVQIYTSNGTSAQKFFVLKNADGTYSFRNASSGLFIDVYYGLMANGTGIWMYNFDGTTAQKFVLKKNGQAAAGSTGTSTKTSTTSSSSKTSTSSSSKGSTSSSSKTSTSSTSKTGTSTTGTYNGTYIVSSFLNRNYVLDVSGASSKDGANIQLYRANATNAQKFKITPVSGGYHKIVNVGSGKVVDVAGAKKANGTNVWQYKWNGTKAQLWKIAKNSDGTVTLKSAIDETMVLDVKGARLASGTNIQIYKSNGTKAQKFMLIQTDKNSEAKNAEKTAQAAATSSKTEKVISTGKTQASDFKGLTRQQVVNKLAPIIAQNARATNTCASARIGMALMESGYVGSNIAQNANNLFGQMVGGGKKYPGSGWDGVSNLVTGDGRIFRKYGSIEASVSDNGALLSQSPNYKACVGVKDYRTFLQIVETKYYGASSSAVAEYINIVCGIIETYNLTQYDS